MGEIRRMVVRSAYAQLRYSPLLLAVAVAGLTVVFAVPVLAALFGHGAAEIFGLLAWVVMAVAFQPTLRFYGLSPLWGPILPAIALVYMAFTLESAYQSMLGRGGLWKGRAQARARGPMTDVSVTNASELRSGKTHRDENFPVASLLVRAEHRRPILAFYEFARVADDVADHPSLTAAKKIELLDRMEADLLGEESPDANPQAAALRRALAERGLSPRHAQDLLRAFRLDAAKRRYKDWADLMSYCALSAMPVGRFVLDVHGESRSTWPASDAICAALQINNHLQDCGIGLSQSRPRLFALGRSRQIWPRRRGARRESGLAGVASPRRGTRRTHREIIA